MEYFLGAYKLGVNEQSQNHMAPMPLLVARKLDFMVIKGKCTTNTQGYILSCFVSITFGKYLKVFEGPLSHRQEQCPEISPLSIQMAAQYTWPTASTYSGAIHVR